jgi:hypothetical protein
MSSAASRAIPVMRRLRPPRPAATGATVRRRPRRVKGTTHAGRATCPTAPRIPAPRVIAPSGRAATRRAPTATWSTPSRGRSGRASRATPTCSSSMERGPASAPSATRRTGLARPAPAATRSLPARLRLAPAMGLRSRTPPTRAGSGAKRAIGPTRCRPLTRWPAMRATPRRSGSPARTRDMRSARPVIWARTTRRRARRRPAAHATTRRSGRATMRAGSAMRSTRARRRRRPRAPTVTRRSQTCIRALRLPIASGAIRLIAPMPGVGPVTRRPRGGIGSRDTPTAPAVTAPTTPPSRRGGARAIDATRSPTTSPRPRAASGAIRSTRREILVTRETQRC